MIRKSAFLRSFVGSLCLSMAALAASAQAPAKTPVPAKKKAAKTSAASARPRPAPEPRAVEILKASCAKLAAAGSMSFTAAGIYEVPSLWGPPLVYGRIFDVVLQRPGKLAVVTIGDGPRTEFYDDGKVMMSFHPAENLVAIADAPPTLDAALQTLYDISATYYPFTDLIVTDPWGDIASGLTGAFYVGESVLFGGVTTDVVAYETNGVFIQMWIGKDDRLPRMARAMYVDDPLQLRQSVQFSNWQLNPPVAAEAFTTAKAAGADRIAFDNPSLKANLPAKVKPAGARKTASPKAGPTPKPQ